MSLPLLPGACPTPSHSRPAKRPPSGAAASTILALVALASACAEPPLTDADTSNAPAEADTQSGDIPAADATQDAARDPVDLGSDLAVDAADAIRHDHGDLSQNPCEGTTSSRYDPAGSDELERWPDDYLTIPDPLSPTGRRLATSDRATWPHSAPSLLAGALPALDHLSGFGRSGAALFRFTAPVAPPPDIDESTTNDRLLLYDIDAAPPARLPYAARLGDDGHDLFVQPILPLRRGARHLLVATSLYLDAAGGCIAPSPLEAQLWRGRAPAEAFTEQARELPRALAQVRLDPTDLASATLFTTHDETATIFAAAEHARTTSLQWDGAALCEPLSGGARRCDLHFVSSDFRDGDGVVRSAEPVQTWVLAATAWLPPPSDRLPVPLLYGHGMGNDRSDGALVAEVVLPLGFAVFATDALEHGDHPTAEPRDLGNAALAFLGLDLGALTFAPHVFGGNFNQTALDWLQLLETVRRSPDLDGDGAPDVDTTRAAVWGVSLGGSIAPNVLALAERVEVAITSVAGGHLATYVTETPEIAAALPLLGRLAGSPERLQRLLLPVQTLADSGDPTTFAAHVLRDRLDPTSTVPDLLFPVAVDDDTVPPAASHALARAFGLPHMEPSVTAIDLLPTVTGPLRANLPNNTTGAFFELDRVGGTTPQPATHGNAPLGPEGRWQAERFLETWLRTGRATAEDPYAALGTAPLDD
jgi:hypothetical protein